MSLPGFESTRYLRDVIIADLKEKMVFLGGPRQVGKTTLATVLLEPSLKIVSYNWDNISQRRLALRGEWPADAEVVVLDEFHKHRKWKTWIKGEYDVHGKRFKFLLTGSARLNVYRRGGDSLQGRYHYYRLHPFSLAEVNGISCKAMPGKEIAFPAGEREEGLRILLRHGGFPEPFLKQSDTATRRWQSEHLERFFKEDVRDLTRIEDFGNLTLLADLLPTRVGSILSINSLAEDLQVNFRTIARWLDVFEELYYAYRLSPFQSRRIAAVRKEKKLYLWDWSTIPEEGARLENLVASHLLKFCHYLADSQGFSVDLHYLRDQTGREADFLVTQDNKPWFAVEVKMSATALAPALAYFQRKLSIPFCYQVVGRGSRNFLKNGIRIMPAERFLAGLA